MLKPICVVGTVLTMGAGCARHQAQAPQAAAPPHAVSAPLDPVIVRLVGRNQTITITAGKNGPLYSAEGAAGEKLVSNASLEKLRRDYPELYRQVEPATVVYAGMELGGTE